MLVCQGQAELKAKIAFFCQSIFLYFHGILWNTNDLHCYNEAVLASCGWVWANFSGVSSYLPSGPFLTSTPRSLRNFCILPGSLNKPSWSEIRLTLLHSIQRRIETPRSYGSFRILDTQIAVHALHSKTMGRNCVAALWLAISAALLALLAFLPLVSCADCFASGTADWENVLQKPICEGPSWDANFLPFSLQRLPLGRLEQLNSCIPMQEPVSTGRRVLPYFKARWFTEEPVINSNFDVGVSITGAHLPIQ